MPPSETALTTRLCLVRHGETAWNAEGRIQGQLDIPLSEAGHAQARALALALKEAVFDVIYSSDLERVRQTAAPAAAHMKLAVAIDPALRERHYGSFQTITYKEAKARFPERYARFAARDPEFDFDGGESLRAFALRVETCIAGIAARHRGQQVLVFTHGGVLDIVYRRSAGKSLSEKRDFELPNAALNHVAVSEGGWRVVSWADRAHLPGAHNELPL